MPAVAAASETESAVAVADLSGVSVGVVAEVETVVGATVTSFRRTLSEVITDGDEDHDTDHEALAQFHNKFDLRDTPSDGDSIQWDGDSYSPVTPVSPYAGSWLDALFVRPDTVHVSDDEFVGTTIDAAWTETLLAGTTTWTQDLGRLSAAFYSQTSTGQMSTILRAVPTSYPFTIETVMSTHPMSYFYAGLCFTNGTISTSTIVAGTMYHDTYDNPDLHFMNGTLADGNVSYQSASPNEQPHPKAFEYMRLVWADANTFKFLVSGDGVSWANYFSDNTTAFTPTHFGVTVSSNSSSMQMAAFEYVRVTESDLS